MLLCGITGVVMPPIHMVGRYRYVEGIGFRRVNETLKQESQVPADGYLGTRREVFEASRH